MSTAAAADAFPVLGQPGGPLGSAPVGRALAVRAVAFGAGVAALLGVVAAPGLSATTSLADGSGIVVPNHSTCCPDDPMAPGVAKL